MNISKRKQFELTGRKAAILVSSHKRLSPISVPKENNFEIAALPHVHLTPREAEIMIWTAHGKTCLEISILLSVSEETIRMHVKNVCRKLKAVNKTHATVLALVNNLIFSTSLPERGI
jgi:DNA-binding CsgD family transcriptional regulator